MRKEDFRKKKVAILGFGVEGESAARFLLKNGASVSVFDIRQEDRVDKGTVDELIEKGVSFKFRSYPESFEGFDLIVRSPGISVNSQVLEKVKKENIEVTSSTKIFFGLCPRPIIGVTGTKGKSTTSALIYEMLRAEKFDVYFGGNIGNPPLNFVDDLKSDSWVVLELSSFQLQDLTKSPQIAVVLMVTSEHLDYHRNVKEYVQAKRNILRFQKPSDFAILNRDYPASGESDVHTQAQVYYVSRERDTERGCYIRDGFIVIKPDGEELKVIPTKDILLPGKHNWENVCAASMAAYLAGVSIENIAAVLKEFKGLEHRLEFVGEHHRVRFYNDSLATIPAAAIEGIEALGDDVETLIAGGYDRGSDYTELGRFIADSKIRTLILFSPTGEKIWDAVYKAVPNEKLRPKKFEAKSMKEAVVLAYEQTDSGKICLMSPGSASFGLFENYKDRGDQFKHFVKLLH